MKSTYQKHLDAVRAGGVQKHHISGIRKLLNASARKAAGYSIGSTACAVDVDAWFTLEEEIQRCRPHVIGPFYDSGLAVLRNPRYAKRLAEHADTIAKINQIRLIRFEQLDALHHVPVFLAIGPEIFTQRLAYRNVPWQSGGDGPEIVPEQNWS